MTTTRGVRESVSASAVSDGLRAAISEGRLVPRQRLVEADIAEEYSASRGNVRIALSELAVEGLVEKVPNKGSRVRAVSLDEAIEITEVRAALESLCAFKAAQKITDDEAAELRELGREMSAAVDSGEREAYSQCNQRLHKRIIEISGQRTAAETIIRLRGQAVRYQYRLASRPGRPAVSLPQHLAIIEAVASRDPEAAAAAMHAHLESVAEAIGRA